MKLNAKDFTNSVTLINKAIKRSKYTNAGDFINIQVDGGVVTVLSQDFSNNNLIIQQALPGVYGISNCTFQFDHTYIDAVIKLNKTTKSELITLDENKARTGENIVEIKQKQGFDYPYKLVWINNSDTLLELCKYASTDTLRQNLICVAIQPEHIVATNGHVLQVIKQVNYEISDTILLPSGVCKSLPKNEVISLYVNDGHYKLILPEINLKFSGLRLDKDYIYPNWKRVIPVSSLHKVTIMPEQVEKIAGIKISGKDAKIIMTLGFKYLYFFTNEDIENAIESELILKVPVERGTEFFGNITLQYNYKYFNLVYNSAASLNAPVILELTNSGSANLLTCENTQILLMPILQATEFYERFNAKVTD